MPFEDFIREHGINYVVIRNGKLQETITGLPDNGYIMFMPDTDVKTLDVLQNPAKESFYVIGTETKYMRQKPHFLKAFYQTENEHLSAVQSSAPVFNIQNAYGSVIGTHNQATINYNSAISDLKNRINTDSSADKADMEKIVSLLEMIVNNQVTPTKGLFSKFSAVMNRHSWLTNSVAGAILSWLLSQI